MSNTEHRLALPIGSYLNQFQIEAVLGYGGFGIVYKAKHKHLEQWVAIKEYLPQEIATREDATVTPLGSSEEADYQEGMNRFLAEAQQLVQFESHPNIVTCRDFFEANGTAYLVMNFEDGKPLSDILKDYFMRGITLTEEQVLRIILPLLDGLRTIHEQGVLHRDIKPGNIFIRREDEKPVLIDFGAAKQNYTQHSKSQAPYSIGYAAYEQVHAEGNLGPWTDLHAIGGVMWRMLSGENPKDVTTRAASIFRNKPDPMVSAVEIGSGQYSHKFLDAIDRCLRINEEDRFQTAGELTAELSNGAAQAPVPPSTGYNSEPRTTAPNWAAHDDGPSSSDPSEPKTQVAKIQTTRTSTNTTSNTTTSKKNDNGNNSGLLIGLLFGVAVVAIIAVGVIFLLPESSDTQVPGEDQISGTTEQDREEEPNEEPPPSTTVIETFQLWVDTTPAHASVTLTDSSGSAIPYQQGMALQTGNYQIAVSAANYASQDLAINLISNQRLPVELTPELQQHQLWVNTNPRTATISINNGTIPFTQGVSLDAKQYNLTVSASGYQTENLIADLRNQSQQLTVNLDQQVVAAPPISTPSQPSREDVLWQDCRVLGSTPLSGEAYFDLPSGYSGDEVTMKLGRMTVPLRQVSSGDKFRNQCETNNCYKVRGNFGEHTYSASARGKTVQGKACFFSVGAKPHNHKLDF